MKDPYVTIFKNIYQPWNPTWMPLSSVLKLIHKPNINVFHVIKALRHTSTLTKQEKSNKKASLPSICFSGTFHYRNKKDLVKYSGIICIDFDHIPYVKEAKQYITQDPYVLAAFISPSGDGLKLLFEVPTDDPALHVRRVQTITSYINEQWSDYATYLNELTDINRVCYMSYDPEIFIAKQHKIFTNLNKVQSYGRASQYYSGITATDAESTYLSAFAKALRLKGRQYVMGEKHKFLVCLAGICNADGLQYADCQHYIKKDFLQHPETLKDNVPEENIDRIIAYVYTNYKDQHATTWNLDRIVEQIETIIKKEKENVIS